MDVVRTCQRIAARRTTGHEDDGSDARHHKQALLTRQLANWQWLALGYCDQLRFYQQHVKGDSKTALSDASRLCQSEVGKNSANVRPDTEPVHKAQCGSNLAKCGDSKAIIQSLSVINYSLIQSL